MLSQQCGGHHSTMISVHRRFALLLISLLVAIVNGEQMQKREAAVLPTYHLAPLTSSNCTTASGQRDCGGGFRIVPHICVDQDGILLQETIDVLREAGCDYEVANGGPATVEICAQLECTTGEPFSPPNIPEGPISVEYNDIEASVTGQIVEPDLGIYFISSTVAMGIDTYKFHYINTNGAAVIDAGTGLQITFGSPTIGTTTNNNIGFFTYNEVPVFSGAVYAEVNVADGDLVNYSGNTIVLSTGRTYNSINTFYYIDANSRLYQFTGSKMVNNLGAGTLFVASADNYATFASAAAPDAIAAIRSIALSAPIPPPPTVAVTAPVDDTFNIGDDIEFTCTVSANNVDEDVVLIVELRRNGAILIDGTRTVITQTLESSQYSISGTAVHTITGLDTSKEGEYFCISYLTRCNQEAVNAANVSKSIITNVALVGDVSVSHPPGDVIVGEPLLLTCSGTLSASVIDGSLHPSSIMWYHDETLVQSTNNVIIPNTASITDTLTIDPFTISSVGDYRCVATIDDSTAETTLSVTARAPRASVSLTPTNGVYSVGDTVTLTCTVTANAPDQRNTAWIRLLKDNTKQNEVEISPTTENGIHTINYEHTLTISNIGLSDAGNYNCRVIVRSTGIDDVRSSRTARQDITIEVV